MYELEYLFCLLVNNMQRLVLQISLVHLFEREGGRDGELANARESR